MSNKIYTGYKATDADIKCRGHQFTVGEWHEAQGELKLCENGFHYCEFPSGPWAYYSEPGTRIWRVEARDVVLSDEPGADRKHVARFIRLVEEIVPDGYRNSGNLNSGYRNSGNLNSGYRNSGDGNSGNRNSGDGNSGDGNSGNLNSGYRNSGYRNSGDGNSGDGNSGDGNATNYSAGYFCIVEPTVVCFDVDTELSREAFNSQFGELVDVLSRALMRDDAIEFAPFAALPNISPEKLKILHERHIAARKAVAR